MNKYWIQIKIGQTCLNPILIFNGDSACHSNTMPTLTCTFNTPHLFMDVPVEFIYQEENSVGNKEIYHESINLLREKGIISTLNMILGGKRATNVKVDIYFNENEDGLCIGLLAPRFLPARYVVKNEFWRACHKETIQTSKSIVSKSAKEVFVSNYMKFSELLPLTIAQKEDGIIIDKWEEVIKSIEGSEILLTEFRKYADAIDTWLKLLCSWGLKQDGCKRYPGMLINKDYYMTDDNVAIEPDSNYNVIVPCWTFWVNENGKCIEMLVSKGIVKLI